MVLGLSAIYMYSGWRVLWRRGCFFIGEVVFGTFISKEGAEFGQLAFFFFAFCVVAKPFSTRILLKNNIKKQSLLLPCLIFYFLPFY